MAFEASFPRRPSTPGASIATRRASGSTTLSALRTGA
jgi:hypothetical protein